MRSQLRVIAIVAATSCTVALGASVAPGALATPTAVASNTALTRPADSGPSAPPEQIQPVYDEHGKVRGYQVDAATRAALEELSTQLKNSPPSAQDPVAADSADTNSKAVGFDWWKVAKCTAAVAAFIALTVFPTARAAKLAVRIGKLVKKYGVKKVAQILTRTYKGSDVNAEAIFKEIAKEATGVAALQVCLD